MYDVIRSIIDHTWQTNGATGDQSYIYYISGVVICVLLAVFIDLIYRVFRHFWR